MQKVRDREFLVQEFLPQSLPPSWGQNVGQREQRPLFQNQGSVTWCAIKPT